MVLSAKYGRTQWCVSARVGVMVQGHEQHPAGAETHPLRMRAAFG